MFGKAKCQDTRKAERYFKERGISFHLVDVTKKGMSPGELRNVATKVGGMEFLLDKLGKRYVEQGHKHALWSGPGLENLLVEDPLLLKTPVVRNGAQATVGYVPEVWALWT